MSFESEFSEHERFLRALARRLASDASSADDLVQDACAAATARAPRAVSGLGPWLFGVIRKRAARRIRAESRRRIREQAIARDPVSPSAADVASRIDIARRLLELVGALEGNQRDAVFLRYYEGLKPQQIADRLAVPVGTVKTRLARALAQLRARLDADHPDGRQRWLHAMCALGGIDPLGTPTASTGGMIGGRATILRNLLVAACTVLAATVAIATLAPDTRDSPPARSTAVAAEPDEHSPAAPDARHDALAAAAPGRRSFGLVEDGDFGTAPGHGQPAGNVAVHCKVRMSDGGSGHDDTIAIDVTTDAQGRFDIDLPQHAELTLAMADGTANLRSARWSEATSATTSREPIVLTRYPRGRIEGVAIDPAGTPVGDARISLCHWQDGERKSIETTADTAGRFVFSAPDPESWLAAERDGFVAVGASTLRELPRGGWQQAWVVLAPAGTLIVDAVDATGGPAPGASRVAVALAPDESALVEAYDFVGASFRHSEPTVQGQATLRVPAGLRLQILVGDTLFARELDGVGLSRPAGDTAGTAIVVGRAAPHALRLLLNTREVFGTVLDPHGDGAVAATVQAQCLRDGRMESIRMERTDANGRFAFQLTPDADWQLLLLTASGAEASAGLSAARWLQVDDFGRAQITMQLAPTARITGHVRNALGEPLAARIKSTWTLPDRRDPIAGGETSTDATGAFSLRSIPGTQQRIDVKSDAFVAALGIDAGPDSPIEVVLDRKKAATILLRADPTGPAVEELEVRVAHLEAGVGHTPAWPILGSSTAWTPAAPLVLPEHGVSRRIERSDGTWHVEVRRLQPRVDRKGTFFELCLDEGPAAITIEGRGTTGEPLSRIATGPIAIPMGETEVPLTLTPVGTCRGRVEIGDASRSFAACVGIADDHGRLLIVSRSTDGSVYETTVDTSTHGHFNLCRIPFGVWDLWVGTRGELERGAPRARQRVIVGAPEGTPIVVKL